MHLGRAADFVARGVDCEYEDLFIGLNGVHEMRTRRRTKIIANKTVVCVLEEKCGVNEECIEVVSKTY